MRHLTSPSSLQFLRRALTCLVLLGAGVSHAADTDGDGLDDDQEATYGTDPALADTDVDGLSDGDEVLVYDTDPLEDRKSVV